MNMKLTTTLLLLAVIGGSLVYHLVPGSIERVFAVCAVLLLFGLGVYRLNR